MSAPSEHRPSKWFTTSLRVRYQESDQMSVVYHANYLNWFEIGRTEMIREMGFNYRDMEEAGVLLPVIDVQMKFRQPARYDDEIMIFTKVTAFTPLRIHYEYEIRRVQHSPTNWEIEEGSLLGELLVTGTTQHVWIGRDWKPSRLDKKLPKLYNALKEILLTQKEPS
ncbi:acyl-CoA thioester hydrolase [Paenibacillus shirakamiensis]|uniref:Acyl-CoA thioester hydrolase n=1 Tax=Paenibacillus shirakamiensis TaxID=1265935 RepID=A0ABS4JLF0_9BACL|nr:thioesterase family protein [Paenibacillus shirakamiensis]MBP2002535.1 acyl-CoA thioester hydrolase [Paenibacillus shirakamiensis]